MKYIIFGAGVTGVKALRFLGWERVLCFVDNGCAGQEVMGKKVISFEDLQTVYMEKKVIIVIASEKYWEEMEQQILDAGNIERYFVFHEKDAREIETMFPKYMLYKRKIVVPYVKVLSNYTVFRYKKIVIYGSNPYLHYLISEVMIQSPYAEIKIVPSSEMETMYSMGCEVCDFETSISWCDCLILNVEHYKDPVREKLDEITGDFTVADLYAVEKFEPAFQYKELEKYKDIHKGKRIFVCGNGPSLRIEDLNKLHENGEICIGCNKVYRAYGKTKWRADYLGLTDTKCINDCLEELPDIEGQVFVGDGLIHRYEGKMMPPDLQCFHVYEDEYYPNRARFSEDFTKGFYIGYSIVYGFGIQLAVYMGCKEIYLLGVDHNYNGVAGNKENYFIDGYHLDDERIKHDNQWCKEKVTKGFEAALAYAKLHGIKIYNVTRGGKLEVFKRVDFDSLFD